MAVAAVLGGAAGGIALDEEDLALGRIALGAVGQLAGQGGRFKRGLAAGRLARLARSLAGAGGGYALVHDSPACGRIFFKEALQLVGHHAIHQRTHLAVAQLGLGLSLELRLNQLDRDHCGQTLAHVVAGQVRVGGLEHADLAAVVVHHAGQRALEAFKMRAALRRVDVVGEAEYALVKAVVPLERHLDGRAVLHALDVHRLGNERRLVAVEVLDERLDAALVVIVDLGRLLGAFVAQRDADALVEERHLAEARLERIKIECAGLEDARFGILAGLYIRPELYGRAGAVGLADDFEVVEHLAALVFLLIDFAALIDGHLQVAAQRVDAARAHAVQAAGDLVSPAAEFAARVQHGEAHLDRGAVHLGMNAHGEAAAVIHNGHGAVLIERHQNIFAIAGQRLVYGVVDDLIDQMMQSALVGGAYIHTGAAAHGLQALKHLYLTLVIVIFLIVSSHFGTPCDHNFSTILL